MQANEYLKEAIKAIGDRAKERDIEAERSAARAAKMFSALTGKELSELEAWQFMCCLKLVRSATGKFKADDFVDLAGYAALAGEAAEKNRLSSTEISEGLLKTFLEDFRIRAGSLKEQAGLDDGNGSVETAYLKRHKAHCLEEIADELEKNFLQSTEISKEGREIFAHNSRQLHLNTWYNCKDCPQGSLSPNDSVDIRWRHGAISSGIVSNVWGWGDGAEKFKIVKRGDK